MNDDIDLYLIDIGKRLSDYLDQHKLLMSREYKEPKIVRKLTKDSLMILGDFFFHSSFCLKKQGEKGENGKYEWKCKQSKDLCCLFRCPKVLEGRSLRKKSKKFRKKDLTN